MTHPDENIASMRDELTSLGFRELRTPVDVDRFMAASRNAIALLAVNSICCCAGGTMRPALARLLSGSVRPHLLGTVFAGQDAEATARAREYFAGHPPSSPAVALFRAGELQFMIQRPQIKGQHPAMLAEELTRVIRGLLGEQAAA